MAKKPRTPPPPRPVQAPQRRQDPQRRSQAERRRLLLLGLFGASGIVALAAVILVLVLSGGKGGGGSTTGGGGSASVAAAMRAAGCTYRDLAAPKPPKGEGQHLASEASKVDWNTYPPAGGQHLALWAVWGFYTDPVDPKQVVHNEEHGGVILWWGPKVPSGTVEQLRAFYNSSPNSMFGTPVGTIGGKSLGSKLALTAWTGDPTTYQRSDWGTEHVAICPAFDEHAFTAFRDAYRGKGPEGESTSANNPGEGPTG